MTNTKLNLRKVLVVDNEATNRRFYEDELGELVDAPYRMCDIESLLRSIPYDLILLDEQLPPSPVSESRLSYQKGRIVGFDNPNGLFGKDLHSRIRDGQYGDLNKNTKIRGISRSIQIYTRPLEFGESLYEAFSLVMSSDNLG